MLPWFTNVVNSYRIIKLMVCIFVLFFAELQEKLQHLVSKSSPYIFLFLYIKYNCGQKPNHMMLMEGSCIIKLQPEWVLKVLFD